MLKRSAAEVEPCKVHQMLGIFGSYSGDMRGEKQTSKDK